MSHTTIKKVGQATHYSKDGLCLSYSQDRMMFFVEVAAGDPSALRGLPVGKLPLMRHLGEGKMARKVLADWRPQAWGTGSVGASYGVRANMARRLVAYWGGTP